MNNFRIMIPLLLILRRNQCPSKVTDPFIRSEKPSFMWRNSRMISVMRMFYRNFPSIYRCRETYCCIF
ncbi:unnamed protein product [Haemonchus placei]|uniref:Secreted protein n=1 Tax=Haemonchus placei TaxID=6290 RepID=A0A0N4W2X5_HAEPC|nr:unnamed protein product [Haemonchus placei]